MTAGHDTQQPFAEKWEKALRPLIGKKVESVRVDDYGVVYITVRRARRREDRRAVVDAPNPVASIRLGVHFGPGEGKRYLNVEYPFDGTPEDFDRAFEACRLAFHERAGASVRPCGYEGPWAREPVQEATGSVASEGPVGL